MKTCKTLSVLALASTLTSGASAVIIQEADGGTVGKAGSGATFGDEFQIINVTNDTGDWIDTYGAAGFTGTLYYGFDFTVLDVPPVDGPAGGLFGGLQLNLNSAQRVGTGNNWVGTDIGFFGNGDFSAASSTSYVAGQTYRLVVKVDFVSGGDDTATAWIDPASSADSADMTGTGDVTFNQVRLRGGNNPNVVAVENIIFATTFEEAAVPEPSSLALLGLGGLFIARRRR